MIAVRRTTAVTKLRAATRAVYYFEHKGGARYENEVAVEAMVAAFAANSKMRLRVRPEDSQHFVQVVENSRASEGYRVYF
jgi:hypothetical protein